MEKLISINWLAKKIGIRPKRINAKAKTLDIIVNSNNEISMIGLRKLLSDYKSSNQTSLQTKENVNTLLEDIQDKDFNHMSNIKVYVHHPITGTKRVMQESISVQNWYTKIFVNVYQGIQKVFDECVLLLTSHRFKFLALFIAIGVQIHHSANLFILTSPESSSSVWMAYGYGFMVDFFIVVIALEGKKSIAKTFAWLTFMNNLLYFRVWINFDWSQEAYTNAISSIIISATIAYTIFAYTDIFIKTKKTTK